MVKKACLVLVENKQNKQDILMVLDTLGIDYDTSYQNQTYDLIISDQKVAYSANKLLLIINKPYDQAKVIAAYQKRIILAYQFYDQVDWLNILSSYYLQYQDQQRLQSEVTTLKVVSRAKGVLMNYLGMSEQEAHYFIEKKAMDNQVSKEMVAKEIIKTYG